MNRVTPIIILCFLLASCATHKIETSEDFSFSKIQGQDPDNLKTIKANEYPQGFQCFEPMMFVLTLGIIPTHCVDDYAVTMHDENVGDARVTVMSGWIPLFMNVLPKWSYGMDPDLPKELVKASEASK